MTNPRRRFWRPRGNRSRAAVLAALLAALVLVPTAVIAHVSTVMRQGEQTRSAAEGLADELLYAAKSGAIQTGGDHTYEIVAGDNVLWGSDDVLAFNDIGLNLPVPTKIDIAPAFAYQRVTFPVIRSGQYSPLVWRLSGLTVSVVSSSIRLDTVESFEHLPQRLTLPGDTLVRAYVFLTPFVAEAAVRRVDLGLLAGVPLLVVLAALCAGFAAGRSLRSVDRLRRQTIAATAPGSTTVVVSDTDDELSAMAGAINDNVRRLRDALAAQQQFVADAAHELRNPLSVLISGLEIADRYPDEARWPDVSAQALRSARRLQELTQDLLMLAQLDARVPERAEPVPLRELCAEVVAARIGPGGPAVVLLDGPDPEVLGDTGRLARVVGNLIDNAVRHAGTAVSIRLGVEDRLAIVDVHNDGPAIAAADRERIFDRFARLDEARTRDVGGTGLGLAIAREAAARHGGTITVLALEAGATFRITLPLHQLVLAA